MVPARSALNPAVQCTTGTSGGSSPGQQRRPWRESRPPSATAAASSGKLDKSPTTPRCSSMVSTAARPLPNDVGEVRGHGGES